MGVVLIEYWSLLMNDKNITILAEPDSWVLPFAENLHLRLVNYGFSVTLVNDEKDISGGWINFILGYTKIIGSDTLKKNKHNLVVHESDLPQGKGFAPMSWQILEGKNQISVCLIEAESEVDSGSIWIKDQINLNGFELSSDWRRMQGEKTVDICMRFVTDYNNMKPVPQVGQVSWYKRRGPDHSMLDVKKSIEDQFNLLRVVDNEKYPAFFVLAGNFYRLTLERVTETDN